jgi:glycosyltransferase involved in cell wall biosynthesis
MSDEKPMRIAVILEGLRPDGGAEALLRTFADHIAGTAHQLHLFFLKPLTPEIEAYLNDLDLPFTVRHARRMVNVPRLLRLSHDLRSVDVVQTNLVGPNVIGSIAARLAGRGSVAVLHNERTYADDHWYHGKAERFALRKLASKVVAVGPRTQQARQKFVPDVTIEVLPNAVAPGPDLQPGERDRLRSELMTSPDGHMILNVGRLTPQKAQTNLISAMPQVLEEFPDAELIIAGQGDLRRELEALVADLDLREHVHLIGTRNDIRNVMAASDLFALPSSWEGLPVSLLEAMEAGLPVLATAVGDIPPVIGDDAGWLIDDNSPETVAEAIIAVLAAEDTPERVSRAKELVATKFHSEAWANTMLDHLRAARAASRG